MVILLNYCGEGELNLSGQRGHILVVDDNEMNRLKLSMGLKKQGHTVLQAEGGQRALEMLRAEPFDLLLLDILMPGIDGYQVLREMKGDELLRDIPSTPAQPDSTPGIDETGRRCTGGPRDRSC